MKVVHIESGLGNQMLSYCELLAARKMNPEEVFYIETIIYEISESHKRICQWNGYELERVFGIRESNICELFDTESWRKVQKEILASRFWEKNWNYPVYFTEIFSRYGIHLINARGDFEEPEFLKKCASDEKSWKTPLKRMALYRRLKHAYYDLRRKKDSGISPEQKLLFQVSREDLFMGQRLSFKYKGSGIERIDREIRDAFQFPVLTDERDIRLWKQIRQTESVAVHARRGDMLSANGHYYQNGYFRAAVGYVKKKVAHPVFLFFCDPGSIEWCRENQQIFGLDMKKDQVVFVDWHAGEDSYRDMQLMAQCRHNIITNSSFGWWASYLNENPHKITISPEYTINTKMWF